MGFTRFITTLETVPFVIYFFSNTYLEETSLSLFHTGARKGRTKKKPRPQEKCFRIPCPFFGNSIPTVPKIGGEVIVFFFFGTRRRFLSFFSTGY